MENTRCKRLLVLWIPVVIYAGLLFYLSSQSRLDVPMFPLSDKVYHLFLYSILGFLFVRAFQPGERHWSRKRILLVALAGTAVYGMTDELHQFFVPGRSPDPLDLMMDAVGGSLGGLLFQGVGYVRRAGEHRQVSG